MAITIISRFVVLTIRAMPSALPSRRIKNSGAFSSRSADPSHQR